MVSERKYHELVASWLRNSFENIEHKPTLDSGREPDFIAYTPFQSYVIEVENTFEDVFTGVGQVMYYARETAHTPVVVIPADDIEEPEFTYLTEGYGIPIIETV